MEINVTTKFNIGDTVYCINGLSVEEKFIEGIHTVINARGVSVFYSFLSTTGIKNEDELFASFEELIHSIKLKKENK